MRCVALRKADFRQNVTIGYFAALGRAHKAGKRVGAHSDIFTVVPRQVP